MNMMIFLSVGKIKVNIPITSLIKSEFRLCILSAIMLFITNLILVRPIYWNLAYHIGYLNYIIGKEEIALLFVYINFSNLINECL